MKGKGEKKWSNIVVYMLMGETVWATKRIFLLLFLFVFFFVMHTTLTKSKGSATKTIWHHPGIKTTKVEFCVYMGFCLFGGLILDIRFVLHSYSLFHSFSHSLCVCEGHCDAIIMKHSNQALHWFVSLLLCQASWAMVNIHSRTCVKCSARLLSEKAKKVNKKSEADRQTTFKLMLFLYVFINFMHF